MHTMGTHQYFKVIKSAGSSIFATERYTQICENMHRGGIMGRVVVGGGWGWVVGGGAKPVKPILRFPVLFPGTEHPQVGVYWKKDHTQSRHFLSKEKNFLCSERHFLSQVRSFLSRYLDCLTMLGKYTKKKPVVYKVFRMC